MRHHDLAQIAVRIGAVAQEGDGAHAGLGTLADLEHHIDAVLVELDDLGRDGRRDAARQAVQLDDLADVFLDPGAGVDATRLQRDFLAQLVLADRAVPLEHHLVDDRVLDDLNHKVAVRLDAQLDVGEQLGAGQGADGDVQYSRVDRIARLDRQIGEDRGLVDTLVAAHEDATDRDPLVLHRRRLGGRRRADFGRRRLDHRCRLSHGRTSQPCGGRKGQQAGAQGPGETKGGRILSDHTGNHRGLASARHANPPRNLNRLSFCRSFQVANNINPSSKARPTR